ncbi:VirB4 family type IV secretion/conjugal transfer ATPase [Vibrio parahaemolyticus]|uniref:VirB4 family type IV secretion/conjugal transfer ATPase n=1 Tax=Vibrio parahaemolyticus TaxID=670 RepID=UPI0028781809|nr:VirB4 family type IV secretion/conjugal transfer ATPase [Vibrio parahaemolyticus]EJE4644423.1 VirB4 family type IV secretion/conjugal transfer ATPase [Vibrio parahaemolyticus]MDS1925666.1 VirB4 family type IV secretion/conjugal transfer ATPase [Vibrio parahaemolyticus]
MGAMDSREVAESEIPISQYLPYSHHVSEHVISTKGAEYLSVWKIGGRSHQSASEEDVFAWVRELNNTLRGVSTANISLWSHVVRRRVYEYPESEFDNSFCRDLDRKYQESFDGYSLMVNDLYLTIVYRPVTDKVMSFFAKRERESLDQKTSRQAGIVKQLTDINNTLESSLKRYDAELLGTYEKDGHVYSSALEFLSFLVNGEHRPVPVCRDRFCDYMAFNRPFFSQWGEVGEIRTSNGVRRFGMLDIQEYDDKTEPGQLNVLLESDFEFVLTHSFSTLSRHAALDYLKRHKRNLIDSQDVAVNQIQEIDEAMDQLMSGYFVMGEHHCTMAVFGDTVEQVRDYLAKASSSMLDVAVMPKKVDLALEAGFWAQLPGNWSYRPRPAPITSLNFLSFSPLHNFMSGKPTGNPWGPAVTILKTVSGTPLYFNFHASKEDEDSTGKRLLGNTMMIGQSSSGKTVTLGFLLAQSQKFKPTVVAFDKDRGMEIAIRAMGGRYLPLKTGEPSGFNPFQLEPTAANMIFLKSFVKKLASAGGEMVTHGDEVEINNALAAMMSDSIDKPLRRLSMLTQFLPNPISDDADARPTVHARLLKWCQGGEYGWLFDNETDALNLDSHRLYGFDITEFLDSPDARTPVMMYLLFRTEGMIDGRRFMYVFDEFWKPLQDEYFEDLAKNKQKTIRKQNGIFVFATQEPGDALTSPIAKTLIQQCATGIFLANPKADYEDYTQGFKLTDAEFELVKGLGEFSRRFLIKQGDSSAIAELNLSGFDDELLILSGSEDNADMVEEIIQEIGDDNPDVWVPLFLQRVRSKSER